MNRKLNLKELLNWVKEIENTQKNIDYFFEEKNIADAFNNHFESYNEEKNAKDSSKNY